jgi:probable HAF family extracellular repeat protein
MARRPIGGKAGAMWGCALPSPSPLEQEFIMESLCKRSNRGLHVRRIVLLFTLLCAAALQPAFGQSFTVKDLGTLPHGFVSKALGINDHGEVVGESAVDGLFQPHAFSFENGVMVDLGTLPGFNPFSEALGINKRGQIAGFSGAIVLFEFAVLIEDGVMVKLPTLPGAGDNNNQALAINDHGEVVGFSGAHAFLFEHGAITDLGTLPGGTSSKAAAINDRGQIVGQSTTASGDMHAFLYDDGVMIDLGTLGGNFSSATGINHHGEIVGVANTASGEMHAFVFEHGVMTDLGTLPGGPPVALLLSTTAARLSARRLQRTHRHTPFCSTTVG